MRLLLNDIGAFLSRHVGQQTSNRVDVGSTLFTNVVEWSRMFKHAPISMMFTNINVVHQKSQRVDGAWVRGILSWHFYRKNPACRLNNIRIPCFCPLNHKIRLSDDSECAQCHVTAIASSNIDQPSILPKVQISYKIIRTSRILWKIHESKPKPGRRTNSTPIPLSGEQHTRNPIWRPC